MAANQFYASTSRDPLTILDLAALEDVVEELLVVLAQLPEQDEQLLV